MQEYNVISIFENYGVELVVAGLVACALAISVRKFVGVSAKVCLALAFLSGSVFAFFAEIAVFGLDVEQGLSKAVTAGAIAVVVTSFIKKLAFLDKKDVKANLEKLLSSIVLSDELDKVVGEIIDKIKSETSFDEQSLKEVLRENVNAKIDEDTLDLVAKFILRALGDDKGEE